MGGLLKKILLVDLFQALWVTFRNQNPKYIYTEQYPTERPRIAERYRGAPRLNINPNTNETLCISCNLCALACPENLIVVTSVRNEQTRRKDLTTFTYDLSRCRVRQMRPSIRLWSSRPADGGTRCLGQLRHCRQGSSKGTKRVTLGSAFGPW
jgi:ferredoxin